MKGEVREKYEGQLAQLPKIQVSESNGLVPYPYPAT